MRELLLILLFSSKLTAFAATNSFIQASQEILEEQFRLQSLISEPDRNLRFLSWRKKSGCSVVILHGLYQSPKDMRGLSEAFYKQGCNVLVPLLPGHWRKDPSAFLQISEQDWINTTELSLKWASELGDKVFVLGHSLGGLLALRLAYHYQNQISKIILISPALGLSSRTKFGIKVGQLFKFDRINSSPLATAYERTAKPAQAGALVQNLISQFLRADPESVYRSINIPSFVISTESDEVISHKEVLSFLNANQLVSEKLIYSMDSNVFHDNIQRSRLDLEVDDPIAWENPGFKEMSQKILKFITY